MHAFQYIKRSLFLLLAVIPVSLIGYFFAVDQENLFFLYEWTLMAVILGAGVWALTGALKTTGKEKWILFSILMFCVQFAVFGLFLGPWTFYSMLFVYYVATAIGIAVYGYTLFKVDRYRFISVIFMILSVLFTLYMMVLNSLWGKDLS